MNVAMSVGLVFAAILGAYLFVLWYGSATVIDKHEDRITVMERRWAETFGGPEPAAELEPEAEAVATYKSAEEINRFEPGDDAKTDEIPVAPPTVPDGMPLAVQSALIERPSPVPRDLSGEFPHPVDSDERKAQHAADIEERLKQFNFTGRDR